MKLDSVLYFILLAYLQVCVGEILRQGWPFGIQGMQNATIIAQAKIPCRGYIGQYAFDVGPTTVQQIVYFPPGEFSLYIKCGVGNFSEYGLRASVFVENQLLSDDGWYGGFVDNQFSDISSSCASSWTSLEDSNFYAMGGQDAITVWPCPLSISSSQTFFMMRMLTFRTSSETARKVTIYAAADNFLPSANFGPFSFNINVSWGTVLKSDVYVEPGVYTFQALIVDAGGPEGFMGSIAIDDVLLTITGDYGWFGLLEDGVHSGPFISVGWCGLNHWGSEPYSQFSRAIGVVPQWIWPVSGNCNQSLNAYEYARVQYTVNVPPRSNIGDFRVIDFRFGASDLFSMSIDSGPPLIASPRDAIDYDGKFFRSATTTTQYSLFLYPGVYRLKFSVATYFVSGMATKNMHLRGVISSGGLIIAVTSSTTGEWKDKDGNNVNECAASLNPSSFLNEAEVPFSNSGVQFIGLGNCMLAPGVYDFYYTLTVPGVAPRPVQSVSKSIATSFSRSRSVSSPVTSRSLFLPDTSEYDSLTESLLDFASSYKISTRTSLKRSVRISAKIIEKSGVSSSLPMNRLALFILGISIVLIAAVCMFLLSWKRKMQKSDQSASAVSKISVSTMSTVLSASRSKEPSELTTTQRTDIGTAFGNVLSVPAYLQAIEGQDFVVDRKFNKSGGADVMVGTAFAENLSIFGQEIVVKRFSSSVSLTKRQLAIFHQEVSITAYLQNCRNIVRMMGFAESPPSIILKMYPHGSLKAWLKQNALKRQKSLMLSFHRDICNGLLAMHGAGLIHCDLKTDNILVDYDNLTGSSFCVLCDFGITQICDSKVIQVEAFEIANRHGFSLMYAAPEVFQVFRSRSSKRHYSSDIYAYGVVCVEILNGGKLCF